MTILQTLMGVIEQKHASSTLILDCDFNDSEFIDKAGNYEFEGYSDHIEPDINNHTWYKITNQLEFEDYRYDCNPDYTIPTIEGSSGSSSDGSLENPFEIRIIADGWDSMFAVGDYINVAVPKLNNYFVLVSYKNDNTIEKFIDSTNDKSTGNINILTGNYYGKIIRITENSNSIEIIGDIE